MPAIKTLLALLLLTSCIAEEPITGPDSPLSTPAPVPTPSGSQQPVPRRDVRILVADKSVQPVAGAKVTLTSDVQQPVSTHTDAQGNANFSSVRLDGNYTIRVEAPGYITGTRQVNLSILATQGQGSLYLGITLEAQGGSVTGVVRNGQGQPLAGATIFDGTQSVLSDDQGLFSLGYTAPPGALTLTINKQGYTTLTRTEQISDSQPRNLGTLTLNATSGAQVIAIDGTRQPLGQPGDSGLSAFTTLTQTLSSEGYQLQTLSGSAITSLTGISTLFIPSPSRSFSAEEIALIQGFVRAGGKLVMTGEWAGFAGFNAQAANQVLSGMGLEFGNDVLRENNSGLLNVSSFGGVFATGLSSLQLYQSSSVLATGAAAQIVARTAETGFRISTFGSFGVAAISAYGSGRVFILGDSSCWSNDDSNSNGVANINESNNLAFAKKVFSF